MSISLGSQYLFRKISKFFTYITWITEVEQIYASTSVKEKTIQFRKSTITNPHKKAGGLAPCQNLISPLHLALITRIVMIFNYRLDLFKVRSRHIARYRVLDGRLRIAELDRTLEVVRLGKQRVKHA